MFEKFKAYVENHGMAKAAFLMGYRDTPVIKSWLKRGSIPPKNEEKVKSLFKTKVSVTTEG